MQTAVRMVTAAVLVGCAMSAPITTSDVGDCAPAGSSVDSFQAELQILNTGSQSLALSWDNAPIPGVMYYDAAASSWRLDEFAGPVPYVGGTIDIQVFATQTEGVTLLNGVCKPLGAPYNGGLFAWSTFGECLGTQMINGYNCTGTKLIVQGHNVNLTLWNTSITTASGQTYSVPVRWNVQNIAAFLPGANASFNNITYDFNVSSYIIPLPPSPETFEIPASCTPGAPSLCRGGTAENSSTVQVLPMVLAQPDYAISGYSLANQNTADWLGDAVFTCMDVLSNHTTNDQYSIISYFEVEVDTRFGVYSQCNGYPGKCLGAETYYVGREAAMGVGPLGSQCANNTDTGVWYSLPAGGECTKPGQFVGQDCSWRIVKRVRSVSLDCVFELHGMRKACQNSTTVPLSLPVQILKGALTEPVGTMPMTGCPDIPPPSQE